MIIQAGDLIVELETGFSAEGEVLYRLGEDGWGIFLVDNKPVSHPKKVENLPPGRYRMMKS